MIAHSKSLAIAALALSACATAAPLTTPSGKPEVLVKAKTQQEAVDNLAASCATHGLTVENQTTVMVTCGKEANILLQALASNAYGNTQQKYQFAAIKQGETIKVILSSAWLEANNGFGGISKTPMDLTNPRVGRQLQADLLALTGGNSTEVTK